MPYAPANDQYLSAQTGPLTRNGGNPLAAMAGLLGPTQQTYVYNPEHTNDTEVFTLSKLMEGKSAYIGLTITSAMQSSNAAVFRLMPMKRVDAIEFVHQTYEFPKEIAARLPEQAAPAYVKVQKSSRRMSLSRYGLAATTTVQELRTTEGQFLWRGKLITLAIGFLEVAELLAIDALLNTPTFYAKYYVERGEHLIDIARAGRLNNSYFDILRRNENGFSVLKNLVRQAFNTKNLPVTHCIISEGMRGQVMMSPMKTEYWRHGPNAAQNAEQLATAIGDSIDGVQLIVLRAVEFRKKDIRFNPLERQCRIGDHARMDFFHDDLCDMTEWCTSYMNTTVFSADADDWATLKVRTAIEYCGRFNPADGQLDSYHSVLAETWREKANSTRVPIYKQKEIDMFLYPVKTGSGDIVLNVASIFGQMDDWALSDDTINRSAQTLVNYVAKNLGDSAMKALGAGLDAIDEIYFREVAANWEPSGGDAGKFGVPPLDELDDDVTGYGSVAGLLEIANSGPASYKETAKQFRSALMRLHKLMVQTFGTDHPALNPKLAPRQFSKNDVKSNLLSVLNFGTNVLDNNKLPLYIGAAAEGKTLDVDDYNDNSTMQKVVRNLRGQVVSPDVEATIGNQADANAFGGQFDESSLGKKYKEYLQSKSTRRRTRRMADGDDVEELDEDIASAWEEFLLKEATKGTRPQKAALLAQVVSYVTNNRPIDHVDSKLFQSFRSIADNRLRDAGEISQGGKLSGLVLPRDKAQAAGVAVASPTNRAVRGGLGQYQADADPVVANSNVLELSIFSGAHAGGAGYGGGLPRAQTAAQSNADSIFGASVVPSFAPIVAVDAAGGSMHANRALVGRWSRYASESDWTQRMAARMVILAPITKQTMLSMAAKNIALPVAFLWERFNRRYKTISAIWCAMPDGDVLGNIYYMDMDVHTIRDGIAKKLKVNMHMYLGAGVNDVQRWYITHDVWVTAYYGGESIKPFDMANFEVSTLDRLNKHDPSMLVFMVPAGSLLGTDADGTARVPRRHDIRGYDDAMMYSATMGHRESQFQQRAHYPSALYYCSLLGLHEIQTVQSEDWDAFHTGTSTLNTTTYQAHQNIYWPNDNDYSKVILGRDQFKDAVYPGCMELRESAQPGYYNKQGYEKRTLHAN